MVNSCRGVPACALLQLDYTQTCCPNCETISYTQGVWLEHRLLLGSRKDMDDIAAAIGKVYENRERLTQPR